MGKGTYRDNPERLVIVDKVTVSLSDLESAVRNYRRLQPRAGIGKPLTLRRVEEMLITRLSEADWKPLPPTTTSDSFIKERDVPLHSRVVPVDTGNEIPLPHFPLGGSEGVGLSLHVTKHSRMTLTAPTHTFDSTRPGSDREERLTGDREDRRIPIERLEAVEVDVRSPWFRSGVTSTAAGWVVSGAKSLIGILVGLVIAVLSEPINDWLKRRLKIGQKKQKKGSGQR